MNEKNPATALRGFMRSRGVLIGEKDHMELKKTNIIADKIGAHKAPVLALLFCLHIFYAPIAHTAQKPASPSWYQRLLRRTTAPRSQLVPVKQQDPLWGPGGIPLEPESLEQVSPAGLAALGYAAPSQEEWENKLEELARSAGLDSRGMGLTRTKKLTTRELPSELLRSRLEARAGLPMGFEPVDWRDIAAPGAKLQEILDSSKAVLESKKQRAQRELEAARYDYEQKLENVKRAQKGVESVQEHAEQFKQNMIAAHQAAAKAVAKDQEAIQSAQEQISFYKKQKEEGVPGLDEIIKTMEGVEKQALAWLDEDKQKLAQAEKRANVATKGTLSAALVAGVPEAESLQIEKKRAAAKLKEAQDAEKKALELRIRAADNVDIVKEELQRLERAPWGIIEKEMPEIIPAKEEKPTATIAIPIFNPEAGWADAGENISSRLWGVSRAKIEERAEKHLQKLTDLLKHTYTPERGPNPEVLAAIQEHIKYMDRNDFPLSSTYRAQIVEAEKIVDEKRYEKYQAELRSKREAELLGLKPKAGLPPFNPAQRRPDQTVEEYAQDHLFGLMGQYHKATTQDEKLKAQQAIKEHAAYMKKQKFAFAKDRKYAQEDKKLVKSFATWGDWLPSLPDWRWLNWLRGKGPQKPVAQKKINPPSSFAALPVFKPDKHKTPEQNAQYYLGELLEHYYGSPVQGIPPNPLAASKLRAHINFMKRQGYSVDDNLERELNLKE